MSSEWTLFIILAFLALTFNSRMDERAAKAIMWAQVGIQLLTIFVSDEPILLPWSLYMVSLLAIVVYAVKMRHILKLDRVLIVLSTVIILAGNLASIEHYKGAGILKLLSLLSIVTFVLLLFRGTNKVYNEVGILFIPATLAGYSYFQYMLDL